MSYWIRNGIIIEMLSLELGGAWIAKRQMIPDAIVLPGVRIDGVPCGDDAEGVTTAQANALLAKRVKVTIGTDTIELTLAELGVKVDPQVAADRAKAIGKSGDLL